MLGLKPIKMLPARERVAAALRKAIISRQIYRGRSADTGEYGSRSLAVSDYTGQRSLSDSGKRRADRSEAE